MPLAVGGKVNVVGWPGKKVGLDRDLLSVALTQLG